MPQQYTISARIRTQKGKGPVRRLRSVEEVPATFYGPNTDSMMLTVSYSDLRKIMKNVTSENFILGLQIESDVNNDPRLVMIKELQMDPISDRYLHADFYEVSMDKKLTVDLPVRLVNIPKGVANGGILQHIRREISVACLPDKLIEFIDLDVSELDIGDSLHIGDINLPEGIESLLEDRLTVVVINAPAVTEGAEGEEQGEEAESQEKTETDSPAE